MVHKPDGYRRWEVSEPRAVLLLVHGLGAHSGRWDAMGDFFSAQSIASYAVDCPDSDHFTGQILDLSSEIHAGPCRGKKVFLVGESLGALISLLLINRLPDKFDGLICISPAFKSKLELPVADYLKIFASAIFDPSRQFHLPFDLSMCTRDRDYVNKMENDARERRSAAAVTLVKILLAQMYSSISVRKADIPLLFLIAGSDRMVSADASKSFFKRLIAPDKTLVEYPDMYHALSIDIGKENVFRDMSDWINKRIGSTPER